MRDGGGEPTIDRRPAGRMKPIGRSAAWVGPLVFLGGLLVSAPGAFFTYKWIAEDEENVYGPCARSGDHCLRGGETLNMTFGLILGALGLAGALFGLWLMRRRRERAARDRLLLERGRQGEAVVSAVQPTGMSVRMNGRIVKRGYRLALDAGDGGAPLIVNAWLAPGIAPGTRLPDAYDHGSRDAVLLTHPPS